MKEIAEPLFQTLANSNLNSSIALTEAHQIGKESSEGEMKGRFSRKSQVAKNREKLMKVTGKNDNKALLCTDNVKSNI